MSRIAVFLFALLAVAATNAWDSDEYAQHDRPRHHGGSSRQEASHGKPHGGPQGGGLRHLMTPEYAKIMKECKKEWKENGEQGNYSRGGFDCLINCIMEKTGQISHGKLNEEKIVEQIHKKAQMEEKIARSCVAEIVKEGPKESCETAGELVKCMLKKEAELYQNV